VAAVCLAAASRPTVVQAAGGLQDPIGPVAQPGQNVNDVLNNILVGRWDKSEIYIAPMDKQNKGAAKLPFDSDFTHVEKDKIYDGITNRAGIANGADPMGMGENTGNLDLISTSYVLNPGSTRATFGYFIKVVTPPDEAAEMGLEVSYYFALFSYDRGVASDAGPAPAATEFFLFGPFQPNGTTIPPNPPALQLGLAIGADGKLLSEVPLNLAAVANFKDKGHAKDESVKPGVDRAAKGCMVCHVRENDGFTAATGPFPWYAPPATTPATPAATPATQAGGNAPSSGGNTTPNTSGSSSTTTGQQTPTGSLQSTTPQGATPQNQPAQGTQQPTQSQTSGSPNSQTTGMATGTTTGTLVAISASGGPALAGVAGQAGAGQFQTPRKITEVETGGYTVTQYSNGRTLVMPTNSVSTIQWMIVEPPAGDGPQTYSVFTGGVHQGNGFALGNQTGGGTLSPNATIGQLITVFQQATGTQEQAANPTSGCSSGTCPVGNGTQTETAPPQTTPEGVTGATPPGTTPQNQPAQGTRPAGAPQTAPQNQPTPSQPQNTLPQNQTPTPGSQPAPQSPSNTQSGGSAANSGTTTSAQAQGPKYGPKGELMISITSPSGLANAGLVGTSGTFTRAMFLDIYGVTIDLRSGVNWSVRGDGTIVITGHRYQGVYMQPSFGDPLNVAITPSKYNDGSTTVVVTDQKGNVIPSESYTMSVNGNQTNFSYQDGSQGISVQIPGVQGGRIGITIKPPDSNGVRTFSAGGWYLDQQGSHSVPDQSGTIVPDPNGPEAQISNIINGRLNGIPGSQQSTPSNNTPAPDIPTPPANTLPAGTTNVQSYVPQTTPTSLATATTAPCVTTNCAMPTNVRPAPPPPAACTGQGCTGPTMVCTSPNSGQPCGTTSGSIQAGINPPATTCSGQGCGPTMVCTGPNSGQPCATTNPGPATTTTNGTTPSFRGTGTNSAPRGGLLPTGYNYLFGPQTGVVVTPTGRPYRVQQRTSGYVTISPYTSPYLKSPAQTEQEMATAFNEVDTLSNFFNDPSWSCASGACACQGQMQCTPQTGCTGGSCQQSNATTLPSGTPGVNSSGGQTTVPGGVQKSTNGNPSNQRGVSVSRTGSAASLPAISSPMVWVTLNSGVPNAAASPTISGSGATLNLQLQLAPGSASTVGGATTGIGTSGATTQIGQTSPVQIQPGVALTINSSGPLVAVTGSPSGNTFIYSVPVTGGPIVFGLPAQSATPGSLSTTTLSGTITGVGGASSQPVQFCSMGATCSNVIFPYSIAKFIAQAHPNQGQSNAGKQSAVSSGNAISQNASGFTFNVQAGPPLVAATGQGMVNFTPATGLAIGPLLQGLNAVAGAPAQIAGSSPGTNPTQAAINAYNAQNAVNPLRSSGAVAERYYAAYNAAFRAAGNSPAYSANYQTAQNIAQNAAIDAMTAGGEANFVLYPDWGAYSALVGGTPYQPQRVPATGTATVPSVTAPGSPTAGSPAGPSSPPPIVAPPGFGTVVPVLPGGYQATLNTNGSYTYSTPYGTFIVTKNANGYLVFTPAASVATQPSTASGLSGTPSTNVPTNFVNSAGNAPPTSPVGTSTAASTPSGTLGASPGAQTGTTTGNVGVTIPQPIGYSPAVGNFPQTIVYSAPGGSATFWVWPYNSAIGGSTYVVSRTWTNPNGAIIGSYTGQGTVQGSGPQQTQTSWDAIVNTTLTRTAPQAASTAQNATGSGASNTQTGNYLSFQIPSVSIQTLQSAAAGSQPQSGLQFNYGQIQPSYSTTTTPANGNATVVTLTPAATTPAGSAPKPTVTLAVQVQPAQQPQGQTSASQLYSSGAVISTLPSGPTVFMPGVPSGNSFVFPGLNGNATLTIQLPLVSQPGSIPPQLSSTATITGTTGGTLPSPFNIIVLCTPPAASGSTAGPNAQCGTTLPVTMGGVTVTVGGQSVPLLHPQGGSNPPMGLSTTGAISYTATAASTGAWLSVKGQTLNITAPTFSMSATAATTTTGSVGTSQNQDPSYIYATGSGSVLTNHETIQGSGNIPPGVFSGGAAGNAQTGTTVPTISASTNPGTATPNVATTTPGLVGSTNANPPVSGGASTPILSTNGAPLTFTVPPTTNSSGNWLTVPNGYIVQPNGSLIFVQPGSTAGPNLPLSLSRGQISGAVQLAGTAGSSGWSEILVTVSGQSYSAVTDPSGNFAISGVPVGTGYSLQPMAPGWTTQPLGPSATYTPVGELSLQPVQGAISGSAVLPDETTISGSPTAQGNYSFSSLPAGSYSLPLSRFGYDAFPVVGSGAGSATSIPTTGLRLQRSQGVMSGTAQLGNPIVYWQPQRSPNTFLPFLQSVRRDFVSRFRFHTSLQWGASTFTVPGVNSASGTFPWSGADTAIRSGYSVAFDPLFDNIQESSSATTFSGPNGFSFVFTPPAAPASPNGLANPTTSRTPSEFLLSGRWGLSTGLGLSYTRSSSSTPSGNSTFTVPGVNSASGTLPWPLPLTIGSPAAINKVNGASSVFVLRVSPFHIYRLRGSRLSQKCHVSTTGTEDADMG